MKQRITLAPASTTAGARRKMVPAWPRDPKDPVIRETPASQVAMRMQRILEARGLYQRVSVPICETLTAGII